MEVKSFNQGVFGATTYICYDKISLDGFIIDCTCCVSEIQKFIKDNKINLKYILITHGHFDHVYCLSEMKKAFPFTPVLMNKDDMPLLEQVPLQCAMAEIEQIEVPCIDKYVDENTDLKLGNYKIQPIITKGHSEGGTCYLIDNILFSGDTLFKGSIGRCDLYGGDFSKIEKSIIQKLFTLNDDVIVYPGHGEYTTIKEEKEDNPYFGKNFR